MRFNSYAFAGTALGLLMAASSAGAAGLGASTDRAAARMPIVLAQADVDNPDQKPNKKERRAERRAEKNSQAGGADQGGAQQSQGAEQPKHQRRNAVEEKQPFGNAGQAQQNARRAPSNDEAPAMKPERGKKRHFDETGGQAAQGGDNGQPAMSKRKHRDENQANQPAATSQAPENAQANEPNQGQDKKHRRNENAKRGGDNGQAVQGKPEQPKAKPSKGQPTVESLLSENATLRDQVRTLQDNNRELASLLESYDSASEGEAAAAKALEKVKAQLRTVEATRDQWMTTAGELRKEVKALRRKAGVAK